jgi:cytochrome b561
MLETCINIHALFGLLLCGLVFARYRWCVGDSPRMPPNRGLFRHLSRIVYLILYLIVGVREIVGILNGLWHGVAIDFNLFDDRIGNGPDHASWDPTMISKCSSHQVSLRSYSFVFWDIDCGCVPGVCLFENANGNHFRTRVK